MNDLRYALRQFVRRPLFAAVVIGTLALGIGASTAIFSVVRGLLLRPLPYASPGELVMVFRTVPRFGFDRSTASWPDFADWRAEASTLEAMGATQWRRAILSGVGEPQHILGVRASASLWTVLGVAPARGRLFTAGDDQPDADPVVVLSAGLAARAFGGPEEAVGSSIVLDGGTHTVVGVMPAGFYYPSTDVEYWEPLRVDPATAERDANFLSVIARLAPGADVDAAQAELAAIAGRIDRSAPDANRGYGVFVESRHAFVVRNVQTALWVLFGAVTLVLGIACANVANLLLVRGASRQREFALRAALGGSRTVILRGLVAEGVVLSVVSGAIGLPLAGILADGLVAMVPDLPRAAEIGIDRTVLGYAVLVSILTGIVFGLVPATRVPHRDVQATLKQSGQGSTMPHRVRRLHAGLVVAQVGLAVMLVAGSALLARHFFDLTGTAPGFRADGLLAARVTVPFDRYPEAADRRFLLRSLMDRTGAVPGVTGSAVTVALPFSGATFGRTFVLDDRPLPAAGEEPSADYSVVAGDFFRVMDIPILRGRSFDDRDAADAAPVAVINQRMARRFWPGESPIGQRFRPGSVEDDNPWVTVIGVAGDVRTRALDEDVPPGWYRPFAQAAWPSEMFVVVRTDDASAGVGPAVRNILHGANPGAPAPTVLPLAQRVSDSVAQPRMRTTILAAFAGLAGLLAVLGIYSVMAFMVVQRAREIGIRMALGADRDRIVGGVLRAGAVLVGIGAALGLVGALAGGRVIRSLVAGVAPSDPVVLGAVALFLAACGGLGCYLPARRASRITPMEAIRHE